MKKRQKNNKINQVLNIVESIAVLSLITILLFSSTKIIILPTIVNAIIKVVSLLLIATIITIELFFFLLEHKRFKLFTLLYYAGALIILLVINLVLPLFSIISLLACNIAKNVYRMLNIGKIYSYDHFAAICKIYNIKTRKPYTRKSTKKATAVAIKSKTKSSTKKTSKSYA